MQLFTVNGHITIVCERKKTRTAFKHEGTLFVDGTPAATAKICYQNRTWECYEFESLLYRLADKAPIDLKSTIVAFIKGYQEPSRFGPMVAIAKLCDLLCATPKESTDWKLRMMKAGLGPHISVPAEWDQLPVEEQERRLNAALGALK